MNSPQAALTPVAASESHAELATSSGIDAIKALAIVLVILGHTQLPLWTSKLIYLFHVPVFFFASGLVARTLGRGYTSSRQVKRLLGVFVIFTLLGAVVTRVKLEVLGRDIVSLTALLRDSFVWGNIQHLEHYGQVLWFIPSLLGSLAALEFARRRRSTPLAIGIASSLWLGCLALTWFGDIAYIPYSLNTLLVAIPFVALGYHADLLRRMSLPVLGSVVAGCLIYGALFWSSIRLDVAFFNLEMLAALPVTFALVVIAFFALGRIKDCGKGIRFIGRNSLPIFILHGYTNNIFSLIYPNPMFVAAASLGSWVSILWILSAIGIRDLGLLKIYSDEA